MYASYEIREYILFKKLPHLLEKAGLLRLIHFEGIGFHHLLYHGLFLFAHVLRHYHINTYY